MKHHNHHHRAKKRKTTRERELVRYMKDALDEEEKQMTGGDGGDGGDDDDGDWLGVTGDDPISSIRDFLGLGSDGDAEELVLRGVTYATKVCVRMIVD